MKRQIQTKKSIRRKTVITILSALLLSGMVGCKREFVVGSDIQIDDINEFYYTYSSSTFPPEYQRYHFYKEDKNYWFYHEKREGEAFPLREEHITVSGKIELTKEQWETMYNYLKDGLVEKRKESVTSGDSGPFLYLYWKKDRGKYQMFDFSSYQALQDFKTFCINLVEQK